MSKAFREVALSRLLENSRAYFKKGGTGAGFSIKQGRMTIDAADWVQSLSQAVPRGVFAETNNAVAGQVAYRKRLISTFKRWVKGRHSKWAATIIFDQPTMLIFDWEWDPKDKTYNPDQVISDEVRSQLNIILDNILGTTAEQRAKEVGTSGIEYEHGELREGNAKGLPSNFKGSSMEARIRDSLNMASDSTKGVENKHVVQIFSDYMEDYFGYDAELKKNRSINGFQDDFIIQGRFTFDDRTNTMNPGNLDQTIKKHFEELYGLSTPNPRLVKHIQNYLSKNVLQRTVQGLFSDSDTPIDGIPKMGAGALAAVFTKSGKLDKRYKINKQLLKDAKKDIKSAKSQTKKQVYKGKTKVTRAKKQKTVKRDKQNIGAQNSVSLIAMLNSILPQEILERMHPPALQNRTGRFRQSAEVKNILIGPKGATEIQYTYQKYPYQTFEPGFAQGSTNRDPRKIIGESIREAAQELLGKKFIKVRRI